MILSPSWSDRVESCYIVKDFLLALPWCSPLLPARESAPTRVEVRGLGVGGPPAREVGQPSLDPVALTLSPMQGRKLTSHDATASSSLPSDSGAVSRTSFSVLTQTHMSDTCKGLPVLGSRSQMSLRGQDPAPFYLSNSRLVFPSLWPRWGTRRQNRWPHFPLLGGNDAYSWIPGRSAGASFP